MGFVSTQKEEEKRNERLRLTVIPGGNKAEAIYVYSSDKREVAKKLIEEFERDPNKSSRFNFKQLNFKNTDFSGVNLRKLGEKALREIDFSGSNLSGQNFSGLCLRGAKMRGAHLEGAHLEGTNLERANLNGACLIRANLEGAVADGAFMEGVMARGANLNGSFKGAYLAGADLSDSFLGAAKFDNARMRHTILNGVTCTAEASFCYAQMEYAKLRCGTFDGVAFTGANLSNADMQGGSFVDAKFRGTNICNTDRRFAKFNPGALDDTIGEATNYGDLERDNGIEVPKPSFGSKVVKMKAVRNELQVDPEMAHKTLLARYHKKLLDQLPTPDPTSS